jgi:hypothetical protein
MLTAIWFKFFGFDFEFSKEFKVLSRPIQKWLQSPHYSAGGFYRILSSHSLAHFYFMKKIRQSAALPAVRTHLEDTKPPCKHKM